MKIINAHLHLIEFEMLLKNKDKYLKMVDKIPSLREIGKDMDKIKAMLSVDNVLAQMQEAGIEKSVLFACIAPVLYASNEFVSQMCQKYPDKFIGFASIHPLQWNPACILDKAVKKLGLKGLKLHPPLQHFYPNDKKMFPVYKKAMQLNIPVVFHVGSTPFGSLVRLDQADPMLLDEVAVKFPELKIVLTHLGTMWHYNAFMVAEKNPNVYIDTAGYPYEIKQLLDNNLINRIGADKFIFGTDFPMPYEGRLHKMKDFVDCFNELNLSNEIKEKIFSKNFERLMNNG